MNRSSGDSLSVVIGDDRTVTPVIDLDRRPSDEPEEYDVRLLQLGGPTDSGVVDALFGRVVRCDAATLAELSFEADALPSVDVWARALLVAPDPGIVLALAVAADVAALEESLRTVSVHCSGSDDYDEVAYHFLDYRDADAGSSHAVRRAADARQRRLEDGWSRCGRSP